MGYFSRPKVFIISIAVIICLGIATWAFDQYLSQLILSNTTEEIDPSLSTAARILTRNKLRVGVKEDAPPFGYVDADGELIGFDVDIAREFARRWLGDEAALEIVKVTSSDRIPRLAAGEVDLVIASMTHKRERDALIDFSQTYYMGGQGLLVLSDARVQNLTDLQGGKIAAIQGSVALDTLTTLAKSWGVDVEIVPFQEYPQALDALQSRVVDALSADTVVLSQFAQGRPGMRIVTDRLTREPYAIGVAQGDSLLREMVDFTLQDIKMDGTYDQIYRHWFPADEPLAIEVSPGVWSQMLSTMPAEVHVVERSRIQEILARGRIVAGVHANLPPFSMRLDNGQMDGFDIDVLHEFARRWLGDANAIELRPDLPGEQIKHLTNGEVDLVAAALVRQREWADTIDYSQTYLGAPLVVEPLSLGLPQNDPMFRELVNVTLQEMKNDGTYDAIYAHRFGADIPKFIVDVMPGDADYLLLPHKDQELAPSFTVLESTMIKVRNRDNLLRVGVRTDFAPFGFRDESGQISGFDVDLAKALGEEWGVRIELAEVTDAEAIQQLVSGEVDMLAAALEHSKDREAQIDFSQTYFMGGQSLLVRQESGISDFSQLDGQTIGMIDGSNGNDQILAFAEVNGMELVSRTFSGYDEAVNALRAGEVAAITSENTILNQLATNDSTVVVVGPLFTQKAYGLGLLSGDSYFNNLVNFTLQTLKQNGRYDEIYRKWFGAEAQPYALEILPGEWPYTFADSPAVLDRPVRSKVDEILARGKLVAGVKYDFKPFGFIDSNGQSAGFDIDIMREFAKRWLGDIHAVEFVPVTSANRINMLVDEQTDIIAASMTHRRERGELIDFSQTYFLDGQRLLVRSDSAINTLLDLNGKVVAAVQGSSAIENIQRAAVSLQIQIEILPFQEYPQAVEALKAGQVDAVTTLTAALTEFARDNPGLSVVGGKFTSEPVGLGVPNHDDKFRDLVNFTLQEMKLDGTYDRVYAKWFGSERPYPIEIWPGRSYLGIDMEPMVRVPGGEFQRGNAAGFPDEKIESPVFVDEFFIDQYEVTNRQYEQCVQAGQCTLPRLPRSVNFARYYAGSSFGNFPVIWVSWHDATAYCSFVGKRLPTEAEWEKAARGPQNTLYPWGNEPPTDQANFDYLRQDVAPVGSYPQDVSGYGVHDMAGNVREWVTDWYQWDYYAVATSQGPIGPAEGVTKVLRGGSWNDTAVYLRSTVRKNFLPDSFDSNLGFRCASSTYPPSR